MAGYELTPAADADLGNIWDYTYETWGFDQADKYFDLILACCEAIAAGTARSKFVEGLAEGLRVHRCQHHYIFFLVGSRPVVLAILHERMDFFARLKDRL